MNSFFESERNFVMWEYIISHNQLVFRSNKLNNNDSTIDIVFKSIKFIHCMSGDMDGLEIRIVYDRNETAIIFDKYNIENMYNLKNMDFLLFEITTKNAPVNYVIASFLCVFESNLNYSESILSENESKGKIIAIMR